jgi:thiol-disulfide isomerase/thioredoxin
MGIRIALACLLFVGCEAGDRDPHEGRMGDYSYGGQIAADGTVKKRANARGEDVAPADFSGAFVWADYAAPWCPPCIPQARVIAEVDRDYRDEEVVFLSVITSVTVPHRTDPTPATARAWAKRFGLDPERVVAATDLWGTTVPMHVLYSPEGQTLYVSTGGLGAPRIREVIERRMADWKAWRDTGAFADWMRP